MSHTIFVVCHLVTCFLLFGSLIVGLRKKDPADIGKWQWVTRICLFVMVVGGVVLEFQAFSLAPAHALGTCALAYGAIVTIELTYGWAKKGELTHGKVILPAVLYALTVVCGLLLLARTDI